MKHPGFTLFHAILGIALLILSSCNTNQTASSKSKAGLWERELGAVANVPLDPAEAQKELNLKVDLIPDGKYGRRLFRTMTPQYITIHSTQNPTGDAYAHAKALDRGALRGGVCGYLCWHFTVQGDTVIQHLPTNERGEHADFDGPGNRYSIGIEMCEHQGNNQVATMERTAKLAATLMYHHKIPVENIRAHYHWPREGYNPPNKDCPHFLLENGRPGETWRWFVGRINQHYVRLAKFDETLRQQKQHEEDARRRKQMVQRVWNKVSEFIGLS
ncbi:MAG: N-acetylmuramoyl-L-alanine amidase [Verrucomicrobiales bacterium]|nr:N-acetylmuramoyl-L-alanine amidase [Verrucomicrobiales bacterium]